MFASRSLAVGLLLAGLAFVAISQDNPVLVGTVTNITDGDTIKVLLSSGPIAVRFGSIDAPELDQPGGEAARAALTGRLNGQEVALEVVTQDRYERLVAVVYLGNENINAWMVRQGHAWAYRQYLDDKDYCTSEGSARSSKRGLWALPGNERHAPWEWRSVQRGQASGYTDYTGESVANCIAAMGQTIPATRSVTTVPPSPQAEASSGHCLIKGNISDYGHIYHVPGGRSYNSTKIDESRGERWFCTEDEARAAGWRPPRG
jgi:endonuclease YncB( thermonuclease family)